MGGVGTALAVFSWAEEKEEGDPGEIADGNIYWCGSLVGGAQGLDNADREGPHYCWRGILFLVGSQLASQAKIELSHSIVYGVVAPHGCEYLTDRAEVLLDRSILDGLPLRGQKSSTDALVENLEEGNGVLNVFEVWRDFQPAAEAPSLAPGSSVFLEGGGRETLGDCLLSSIVVSCLLYSYGRWSRRQGLFYVKCERK